MLRTQNPGDFHTATVGDVTSIYQPEIGLWNVSGNLDYVNVILAGIQFQPSLNYHDNFSIAIMVIDQYQQEIQTQLLVIHIHVESEHADSYSKGSLGVILGTIFGVVGVGGLLGAGLLVRQRRQRQKEDQILFDQQKTVKMDTIKIDDALVGRIKSKDLRLGRLLGQGGFGSVYKGIWKSGGDINVAIKQMNCGNQCQIC